MLNFKRLVLAASLTALFCASAQADSLKQVVDSALQFDPALKAARAELESGLLEENIALARLLPRISYSLSEGTARYDRTFTNTAFPSSQISNNRTTSEVLQFRQAIYDPEAWSSFKIGSMQSKLAVETFRVKAQDFYSRVLSAYLDVLFANRQFELSVANQRYLQEQSARVQNELKAGEVSKVEGLDARAKLDLAVAQRLETEQNLDIALKRLESFTGKKIVSLKTQNMAVINPLPIEGDYASWEKAMLDASPDVRAAELNSKMAAEDINRQFSGHKPRLSLVVSRSNSVSDSINTLNTDLKTDAAALQLEVPLYAGNGVVNSVRKATFNAARTSALVNQVKLEKSVELQRNFTASQISGRKLAAYQQAVNSAELALRAAESGRKFGTAINADILNATQQLFIAKRDLLKAQFEDMNNKIKLYALVGKLERKVALELDQVMSGPDVVFEEVVAAASPEDGVLFRRLDVEPLVKQLNVEPTDTSSRAAPLIVPYFGDGTPDAPAAPSEPATAPNSNKAEPSRPSVSKPSRGRI